MVTGLAHASFNEHKKWKNNAALEKLKNTNDDILRDILIRNHFYMYINPFSAGTVFIRQNLTSADVRFWRIKTVSALKELKKF